MELVRPVAVLSLLGIICASFAGGSGVCDKQLTCGDCWEAHDCLWCGLEIEEQFKGKKPTTGRLGFGQCIASTDKCDSIRDDPMQQLLTFTDAETEGALVSRVSLKLVTAVDQCVTAVPTAREAFAGLTCQQCIYGEGGWWCDYFVRPDPVAMPGVEKKTAFCVPNASSCSNELINGAFPKSFSGVGRNSGCPTTPPDCDKQLTCGDCFAAAHCSWCAAKVEETKMGKPIVSHWTGLGKCVPKSPNCDGIKFGNIDKLMTLSEAETGGTFSSAVSVQPATDQQTSCITKLLTPQQTFAPQFTSCPDCLKGDNFWCDFASKRVFTPSEASSSLLTTKKEGGVCMPKLSHSCNVGIIGKDAAGEMVKATAKTKCPSPSAAYSKFNAIGVSAIVALVVHGVV